MNNASTTLQQLGGAGRLSAMTGAKNFMHYNEGRTLAFKICAKNKARASHVEITLDPSDTYTVRFFRTKRSPFRGVPGMTEPIGEPLALLDVHAMRQYFEEVTGFYLSL